jgi:hypothetical protein
MEMIREEWAAATLSSKMRHRIVSRYEEHAGNIKHSLSEMRRYRQFVTLPMFYSIENNSN